MTNEELFDPKDFESITLEIAVSNLSTGTTLSHTEDLVVIEMGEQSLTLCVPKKFCGIDNHVMLDIRKSGSLLLSATAKVKSVAEAGDENQIARFDLMQFDKKSWAGFVDVFQSRQKEIELFFENGKK